MTLIFFDTETTDVNDSARLVQLAYRHAKTGELVSAYFKPPTPISYGAMSVHHITNEMVADKPMFVGSEHQRAIQSLAFDHIFIAHNAPFDLGIMRREGVEIPRSLDTLRLSRILVPAEQHKLQYLRYFLDLRVEGIAHDAVGDVLVLEALFAHLCAVVCEKYGCNTEEEIIEKMFEISDSPAVLSALMFGKYAGKSFAEVYQRDKGYIQWLHQSESSKAKSEQNRDLLHTLEKLMG